MEMDFCLVTINMMKILQKFANSGGGEKKKSKRNHSKLHKFVTQVFVTAPQKLMLYASYSHEDSKLLISAQAIYTKLKKGPLPQLVVVPSM